MSVKKTRPQEMPVLQLVLQQLLKIKAIGNPAKVPNPLTVPAIVPTKNFEIL